jgi:hypothetical protein
LSPASGIQAERWRQNWRTLGDGAVRVEVRAGSGAEAARRIRQLPPGTPVVLAASGPTATRRCRAMAARTGVELEREFLAIPTATAPGCLVENAAAPVGAFVRSVLVAPQDTRLGPIVDAGLAGLRAINPLHVLRIIVPGRLLLGMRT